MEKTKLVFNVPHCPTCGKAHKYSVGVLRSNVLFGTTNDTQTEKRVRRLFICPEKGTKFEGVVVIPNDPHKKIASIAVEGLMEEEK
jgi:hypothetical protein